VYPDNSYEIYDEVDDINLYIDHQDPVSQPQDNYEYMSADENDDEDEDQDREINPDNVRRNLMDIFSEN